MIGDNFWSYFKLTQVETYLKNYHIKSLYFRGEEIVA